MKLENISLLFVKEIEINKKDSFQVSSIPFHILVDPLMENFVSNRFLSLNELVFLLLPS